ncbi:MAG: M48 family metalloprotease [Alphaproteobacteria bacterium]|nr:M48 family metalloprotease [Alphaproteobacteria bacterium]MBU0805614.1 M48 family metalloprotease [Alphaproteobacteria bacterium]MBU0873560.1 M48 family metalloprotease [Alphaproteobacteria bacterium]MBU1401212.1 M48 family metalloprotease [Alphaproteobacteria bacterium]MBU1592371.1 M48 family metalloprotease [Alphaproteobacteria bacterium]
MTLAARFAGVAGLVALVSGCQALSSLSSGDIKESAFRPSENPVTVDSVSRNNRLAELAKSQHPRILATYGGEYSDPKLERMVAKVVGNLTTVSGNPGQAYRITILNSPNVNAFALPGGYLYVTRGLLALANDSAELAAVIAHEMGHVTANHGLQRQQKEAEEVLATKVVKDVLGGNPTANVALIRGKLRLAQFSRNQELEADAIGIKASGQAGFDATAASRFLQSMSAYTDFRSVSGATDASLDFLASHPNAPQRIELAQRHALQFGNGGGARDRDSYLAGIDGLLYGDTPEEGYVRGNTFLHPKLGISFSVPTGFIIDNSAAAVTATGPGDVAIRFDGVAVDKRTRLTDYIRSGWVAGLQDSSVEARTINGNEAASARAAAEGWQFDITVVRAGDQVYRLLTAAPVASTQLDSVAATVGGSFKLLSAQEKAALKPLRIRIVTVQPGQTTGAIAAQMVGVDRKLDLFRVLNALAPGASVSAGDKVKIVTDR